MKNKILFLTSCILIVLCTSCNEKSLQNNEKKYYDGTDLADILNKCDGHAVVVRTGRNPANFDFCEYEVLIKDDSNTFFKFSGTDLGIKIGDTLK